MDFSKFSDDNFNVKDWINGVFRAQQNENQREAYTATLVTKLQRYIQEANRSLEEISQQTIGNLPRVLRDVEALKQEALLLWQQMQQVKEEIRSVEQRTSHSMEVLVSIDDVRSRVESASAALKEADNWSSLASAMEDVFKTGNPEAIAAQLESMRLSLEVLKNSPDYEDKVLHLEALKNRLESSMSTGVSNALLQHNTEEAKRFHAIFSNLGRMKDFSDYHMKCHRGCLSSKWQEVATESIQNNERSEVALLGEFYELLLSTWHKEIKWCSTVYGKSNAPSIVARLLLEVTLSVEYAPSVLINNAMQGFEAEKLQTLTELHKVTKAFAVNLKQAMTDDGCLDFMDADMLAKLADAFWHSYIPYFLQYKDLETKTLLTLLSDIQLDAHDIIDLVRVLESSVNKLFDHARAVWVRCETLTDLIGACDAIEALECYFAEYCDRFARQLRTIAANHVQKRTAQEATSGGFSSDDDDWSLFQHCVRIITTCGRLLIEMTDFSHTVSSSLTSRHFSSGDGPAAAYPWLPYNYLKFGDPQRFALLLDLLPSDGDSSFSVSRIFEKSKQRFHDLNQQAHNLTFDVAFAQVKRNLMCGLLVSQSGDSSDTIVSQSEMPMFSVTPSEQATHIGQYIMTLPQHLEPFSGIESDLESENHALDTALKAGRLPFPRKPGEKESEQLDLDNMSDQWLGAVVRATEHTYIEAVTQMVNMDSQTARQLVADFDYLTNVIDSLTLPISQELKDIRDLLSASTTSQEQYKTVACNAAPRLVDAVARMRSISL